MGCCVSFGWLLFGQCSGCKRKSFTGYNWYHCCQHCYSFCGVCKEEINFNYCHLFLHILRLIPTVSLPFPCLLTLLRIWQFFCLRNTRPLCFLFQERLPDRWMYGLRSSGS